MYPHIHWNDCEDGAVFELKKFEDGPHQGLWGILSNLPDGRRLWVSLGDPAEVLRADRERVAKVLADLFDCTAAIRNAVEAESRLTVQAPERELPVISWRNVTPDARLREMQLGNGSWLVVATLADGDHVVVFDEFAQESGYRTVNKDRESARSAIVFLEATLPPVPPFAEGSDGAEIPREMVEADLEEIDYIMMGWHSRLHLGKRETCLCSQCRHEYNHRLEVIMARYEDRYGFVPSLILNAVDGTLSSWKASENVRPPINWYAI